MRETITNAIGVVITMHIAAIILGVLNKRKRKQTTDINSFTIGVDNFMSILMVIGSLFWFILAFMSSFNENEPYAWVSFSLLGLILLIVAGFMHNKIIVNTQIIEKSILPPRRRIIQFSEISHYSVSNVVITLHIPEQKSLSFNEDCYGKENMLKRLQKEGKHRAEDIRENIGQIDKYTIKKEDVLALKNNSSIIALIVIFIIFGIVMIPLLGITFFIFFISVILLCAVGIYFYQAYTSYMFMKRQETALGIDFNEDMKNLGIETFDYKDDTWFGVHWNSWQFLIHRDYIEDVVRIFYDAEQGIDIIKIRTIDGKTKSWKTNMVGRFEEWYTNTTPKTLKFKI